MAEKPPFQFTVEAQGSLVVVDYVGHMPAGPEPCSKVEPVIREVAKHHKLVRTLYRVAGFSTFHPSQVQEHAAMMIRLTGVVAGIGVVQPQAPVRFGALTVALISKTPLKTFDDEPTAIAWLDGLAAANAKR